MNVEAFLHNLLQRWILRTAPKSIGEMPLFIVSDIPFICAFPFQWLILIRRLALYQSHLQSRNWLGLSAIYPRIGLWAYVFSLFSWGEYCNCLDTILRFPDRSLVAEIFMRHICQIDFYIDAFDSKSIWLGNPTHIKALPEISITTQELCCYLKKPYITSHARNFIVQLINTYRRNALKAMRDWASSLEGIGDVIQVKYLTAGMLWYYWSWILGVLYDVPLSKIIDANNVFLNYGMMIQIVDDLADAPVDYKTKTHNIFISIIKLYPNEWDVLQAYFALNPRFLGWPWVREHLPASYRTVLSLYNYFGSPLLFDKNAPIVTRRLYYAVERIRRMST